MAKTKILNVRIEPELKKRARKIAERDGRSLSNWVTLLIEREVRKAGSGDGGSSTGDSKSKKSGKDKKK